MRKINNIKGRNGVETLLEAMNRAVALQAL
jgi:hypothetical protein